MSVRHPCKRFAWVRWPALALAAGIFAAWPAIADNVLINLEWRPAAQTVTVGVPVEIGLYAVSSQNQQTAGMRVCLEWDSEHLDLLGVDNDGPYPWLFSGLRPDDPLNEPLTDGTGLYRAMAQFGVPAVVTPEGLLLTTVEFTGLTATPVTAVTIPLALEDQTTVAWGWTPPNVVLTGTLGAATVTLRPLLRGDLNCDGLVNAFDIDPFVLALLNQLVYREAFPTCNAMNGDINQDGLVNAFDIDPFIECLLSQNHQCP